MSIENTGVIDFVGIEKETGRIVLTISDHLGWSEQEEDAHIELLQQKINSYLAYIESGQIAKDYSDAFSRTCVISVVAANSASSKGTNFFDYVREQLRSAGYEFRVESLPN